LYDHASFSEDGVAGSWSAQNSYPEAAVGNEPQGAP
jgi:hypothetical protein